MKTAVLIVALILVIIAGGLIGKAIADLVHHDLWCIMEFLSGFFFLVWGLNVSENNRG